MARGDIADSLTLETVSRKLNALKRLGAIELAAPAPVRITNLTGLAAIAEAA